MRTLTCLAFFLASISACSGDPSGNPDAGDAAVSTKTLGFTPSNLGVSLDAVDTSKLIDIDITSSTTLSVSCLSQAPGACYNATLTQTDGTQILVYYAKSWRIEPNAVVTPGVDKPIVLVALDTIDILGKVDASGAGFDAVGGGFTGATTAGAGTGGGGLGSSSSNTPGVGGGGGAFCGGGGAGGNASGTSGAAGKSYGSAALVPLLVGSAGGGGALFGGASGGAFEFVAGKSVTIEAQAVIAVGGGGGASGNGNGTGQSGSGGGSGGGILIESPNVTVAGSLLANGGGGGGGAGSPNSEGGKDAVSAQAAAGGNASTTGAGGNGGAATTSAGANGSNGDLSGSGTNAAGGGGGGAGYIRINTKTGSATLSGTLSPAIGTTCTTQGTLAL